MFNHSLRYLFIVVLASYSYLNTVFSETFRYYGISENPWIILSVFVYICLLVWEGNRVLEKIVSSQLLKRGSKSHPLLGIFLASQLVAAVAGVSAFLLSKWLRPQHTVQEWQIAGKLIILFAFRINLFLQCLHAIFYLLKGYRQKELEAEELRAVNTQASLQAVRNQVNPHFLFNNLNVLSSLIMHKNEEANIFIEKFSTVYRTLLRNQDSNLIPLKEELEFIRPYLYLLEKRFGDGLQVNLDIAPDKLMHQVIPIALQMLVENAIKHNVVSSRKPLEVRIYTDTEGALVVENNIQPRQDKEPSTQVGLSNIRQRLKLSTGRILQVYQDSAVFRVSLPLIYSHSV
jgi:two-component sensor histidine kinase